MAERTPPRSVEGLTSYGRWVDQARDGRAPRSWRERVLLYNAACALTFLAARVDTRPEERPCGRTLVEDLRWARIAVARAMAS